MTPAASRSAGRRSRRLARAQARALAREAAGRFTDREVEILQAVVDHAGASCAAAVLGITEATVKGALETMRSKAGVMTTYQLTLVAAHRLTPHAGPLRKQG